MWYECINYTCNYEGDSKIVVWVQFMSTLLQNETFNS